MHRIACSGCTLQLGARRPWVGPLVSGHPWRTCCRSEHCPGRVDRPLLPLAQQMVMVGPRKRTSPAPLQRQGTPVPCLFSTQSFSCAGHHHHAVSCLSLWSCLWCVYDRTPRAQAAPPVSASGVRDDNWFFSAPTLSGVRFQTLAFLGSRQCGRGCNACVHVRACVRVCVCVRVVVVGILIVGYKPHIHE